MPWNWSMKKRKNQFFSRGMHIFSNFFFLKYFLVDKLANAKKNFRLVIFLKNKSKNDFWLWGPWEPGRNDFLKNFNLFHLSYALTTIFIIKVRFPANTDILTYANDIKLLLCSWQCANTHRRHIKNISQNILISIPLILFFLRFKTVLIVSDFLNFFLFNLKLKKLFIFTHKI
jgi:hypothetical protein